MDVHTVLFVEEGTEIRADANLYALKLGEPGQCAIFFAAGEPDGRPQAVAALHAVTQLIAAATLIREAALRASFTPEPEEVLAGADIGPDEDVDAHLAETFPHGAPPLGGSGGRNAPAAGPHEG